MATFAKNGVRLHKILFASLSGADLSGNISIRLHALCATPQRQKEKL